MTNPTHPHTAPTKGGEDTERTLTRWERYYLARARSGIYASFPRNSKVADSLIEKGYISGFGFVIGNRVEHNLTQAGVDIWDATEQQGGSR